MTQSPLPAPVRVQTVGQLRAALADLPDDLLVVVPDDLANTATGPELVRRRVQLIEGMSVPTAYYAQEGDTDVLILFPS